MSQVEARPQPAPGWTPGTCFCGCGFPIKHPRADRLVMFYSREHRSTMAPDGRLVTEFETKWCKTCARRLTHDQFPTKTVRRKQGYVERICFYCYDCMKVHLHEVNTRPEAKEKAKARARESYQNPAMRERQLKANRERYWAKKSDPVRHEALKAEKREDRRLYIQRLKQDPERWAKFREREQARYAAQREQRRLIQLDKLDPMVLRPEDPMRVWLYDQCVKYVSDRDMRLKELLPDTDITKWKSASTHGGRYMKFSLVDEILVRLDLQHHLDDFTFVRRSELTGRVPQRVRLARERA